MFGGNVNGTSSVERYSITNNTWQPFGNMPSDCGTKCILFSEKIYCLGGANFAYNNSYVYTPGETSIESTWNALAPIPMARYDHSLSIYNNLICAFGGELLIGSNTQDATQVDCYNATSNSWSQPIANVTYDATFMRAVTVACQNDTTTPATNVSYIYITGDKFSSATVYDLDKYDPLTNTWSSTSTSSHASHNILIASDSTHGNQTLYSFGRNMDIWSSNSHSEKHTQKFDCNMQKISNGADSPHVTYAAAAVSDQALIYIMGGLLPGAQRSNVTQRYNTTSDSWDVMAPMNTPRHDFTAVVVNTPP